MGEFVSHPRISRKEVHFRFCTATGGFGTPLTRRTPLPLPSQTPDNSRLWPLSPVPAVLDACGTPAHDPGVMSRRQRIALVIGLVGSAAVCGFAFWAWRHAETYSVTTCVWNPAPPKQSFAERVDQTFGIALPCSLTWCDMYLDGGTIGGTLKDRRGDSLDWAYGPMAPDAHFDPWHASVGAKHCSSPLARRLDFGSTSEVLFTQLLGYAVQRASTRGVGLASGVARQLDKLHKAGWRERHYGTPWFRRDLRHYKRLGQYPP